MIHRQRPDLNTTPTKLESACLKGGLTGALQATRPPPVHAGDGAVVLELYVHCASLQFDRLDVGCAAT